MAYYRMHIAMIGQKGMPAIHGGVEQHVDGLSRRLVQHGVQVTVYARKWYAQDMVTDIEGVHIQYVPTIHTKHLDAIVHTLFATIHAIRSQVDIIHYHGVGPSLLSWIPRVFASHIRIITTFHSIDRKHQKWNGIARLMLRFGEWTACQFAHKTIAVSRTIQQYARDVYDAHAEYIPNAVALRPKTAETNRIRAWSLTPQKYVLMVSRLIPHKGAHYLIDAWKRIQEKNPKLLAGMKLVIVGDGYYTDTYVEALHAQAEDMPDVVFMGFQSGETLHQLYSHARFAVHPSDNEGLPIVVLEAMSYGLPVLVSDILEHRDLITDTAYQFTAGSIDDLAKKMSDLIETDVRILATVGEEHKHTIEKEYEWNKIVASLVHVYTEEQAKKNEYIFATR
ncbi:MAG: glycosyltransferase family 4 protein [Candidatus Magasanikbacteria bacterium]|nr:glycosyltransferase family 4 protein [Candidatus Magasanikbacteria bacterium]